MRLTVAHSLHGLDEEKTWGCLLYFSPADILQPAFCGATPEQADKACLSFWSAHRGALLKLWDELLANGQQPRGAVPWGWAVENGWSFHQWYEHNRAARIAAQHQRTTKESEHER